jgi:hypothetical protein
MTVSMMNSTEDNSDASSNFCDISKLCIKSHSTKPKENNSMKTAGITPMVEY